MNIFDQTGVNEQGLRPTLKKKSTMNLGGGGNKDSLSSIIAGLRPNQPIVVTSSTMFN